VSNRPKSERLHRKLVKAQGQRVKLVQLALESRAAIAQLIKLAQQQQAEIAQYKAKYGDLVVESSELPVTSEATNG
jgi:hypothetical protein